MRGKSHISLGYYLIDRYLSHVPRRYQRAFLLGCIEPDRNPATYLKGSVRFQWLRGHNFLNAQQFMQRIAARLEKKESLRLWDYYTLGKLIHYTTDAFTFAHNETFPEKLSDHMDYEVRLQNYFLDYLQRQPAVTVRPAKSVMDGIFGYHREYREKRTNIYRDSRFAVHACCCVLAVLFAPL